MSEPNFIIAQINPKVGDIEGNIAKICAAAKPYRALPQAVVVFPELASIGYPPEDLVLRPEFASRAAEAIRALAMRTKDELPAIIVGGLYQEHGLTFNAAFVMAEGEIKHIHEKSMLPNYGIFDEKRVFARGSAPVAFELFGKKLGLLVCEDAWFEHNFRILKAQGAAQIVIINASPFEAGKQAYRRQMLAARAEEFQLELIYTNLVGGQDDIVFDGQSFAVSASGEIVAQAPAFEEYVAPLANKTNAPLLSREAEIWHAARLGLHDYIHKNGFKNVLLGLSGGIDSAIVAALAADALGPEHVLAVMLPTEFNSQASFDDAMECASLLDIKTLHLPITTPLEAMEKELVPGLKQLGVDVANWRSNLNIGGNIQSRLRGLHLMSISNATGALLLSTSNKSELAVGYLTLYGDSCGAYAPIKDIYKTEIYRLAAWRNGQGAVIPESIITKAPSAELAPNQKDSDQLPEYDVLDAILHGLIEEQCSIADLAARGHAEALVARIYELIKNSEYKRRQTPPGSKISNMHMNRDWRYPMTNGFKN